MRLEEMPGGLIAKLSAGGYKKYIALAAAAGLVMVGLSGLFDDVEQSQSIQTGETTMSQYCADEEKRLQRILSHIEGVGDAHIMITLENGVEYRYAADQKHSGDSVLTYADGGGAPSKVQETENTEQSYILVGSASDRKPLVVTELSPKVKGVVVVCEGGADAVVRQRVTEAVTTALGINSLQVCVTKASK